jgi:hypothetical protein
MDDTPTWFHEAVRQAQTVYYNSLVQHVEHYAMFGKVKETRYKGERVYRKNPEYDLLTDEELKERGIETRYLRDPITGDFVVETEHHDAPVQLQIAVLQARAPKIYSTKISHDVTHTKNVGVTVIQPPKVPPPVEALPPPIDAEFAEVKPAKPPLDFLDDQPPKPQGFKIV